MKKISSDSDVFAKYLLPGFMLLFSVVLILASISSGFYIGAIIGAAFLSRMLLSRRFYRLFKLTDVWLNEEERFFLISTSKGRIKMPFEDLRSARQVTKGLDVELLFTNSAIYFIMKDDGGYPFGNKGLLQKLNEIAYENRKNSFEL